MPGGREPPLSASHSQSRASEAREDTSSRSSGPAMGSGTHTFVDQSLTSAPVRWEKKVENYLAFLHLACAQLIFVKVEVFG